MNKIYAFWTGENIMPEVRLDCLKSMKENSEVDVVLINPSNLNDYINPADIHPSYQYLNLAHKADYLRCYFMHHFGGGYCDIKNIKNSWLPSFNLLCNTEKILCVGYQEINRWGVANIHRTAEQLKYSRVKKITAKIKYRYYQLNYKSLIGNGAFIFKPRTALTQEWWDELNVRLDILYPELIKNPARYPKEYRGRKYDGLVSNYAVPWSYILADILHPLSFKYRKVISRTLTPPKFTGYQ